MQFVVCKIARIMQFSMGTTAIESLNAATNIFIGMVRGLIAETFHQVYQLQIDWINRKAENVSHTAGLDWFVFHSEQAESCIILKPFLHKLTKSELHAVMTGGFATVAGSYIALLVEVGVRSCSSANVAPFWV